MPHTAHSLIFSSSTRVPNWVSFPVWSHLPMFSSSTGVPNWMQFSRVLTKSESLSLTTCRLLAFSMFFTHLLACACGSIIRGQRRALLWKKLDKFYESILCVLVLTCHSEIWQGKSGVNQTTCPCLKYENEANIDNKMVTMFHKLLAFSIQTFTANSTCFYISVLQVIYRLTRWWFHSPPRSCQWGDQRCSRTGSVQVHPESGWGRSHQMLGYRASSHYCTTHLLVPTKNHMDTL